MPKSKQTHKVIEVEEVPVHRNPRMQGQVSPASIEKPNAPFSKSQIESIVENFLDDSPS